MCSVESSQIEIISVKRVRILTGLLLGSAALGSVGCLLGVVGAVTPEWVVTDHNTTAGIIIACKNNVCNVFAPEGALAASKVFVVVAFFCTVAGVIINMFYYIKYFRVKIEHRSLSLIAAVIYFIAAGFDVAGVIIFAAKAQYEAEDALKSPVTLGYSFMVTVIATVFCGLAGSLSLAHLFCLTNQSLIEDFEYFQRFSDTYKL